MFISKKELESIRNELKALRKDLKSMKQSLSISQESQKKKNKIYDETIKNRSLHEQFNAQQHARDEFDSLLDEWQNGESKNKEGNK